MEDVTKIAFRFDASTREYIGWVTDYQYYDKVYYDERIYDNSVIIKIKDLHNCDFIFELIKSNKSTIGFDDCDIFTMIKVLILTDPKVVDNIKWKHYEL